MPGHTLSTSERENLSATSVLKTGTRQIDPKLFGEAQRMLIYRAATLPGVARIFVAPGIKRALCDITWRDRSFLRTVRPWYGHDDHIHVRLSCPAGASGCVDQAPPPAGDGCGDELAYWFTDEPYKDERRTARAAADPRRSPARLQRRPQRRLTPRAPGDSSRARD